MTSNATQLNRALLDAVVMRNVDQVRELLARGADVKARDQEHDEGVLILAAKFADVAMAQLLLNAGAAVDERDDQGRTALFFAQPGSKLFEVLLRAGANVNARDEEGNTILMRKVGESASLPEVEELLRLGIDLGARNKAGESAFDIANGLGLVLVAERLMSPAVG